MSRQVRVGRSQFARTNERLRGGSIHLHPREYVGRWGRRRATSRLPCRPTMVAMKHRRTIARVQADLRDLEASAGRAGLALACAFSSAAEFEAEVIRARREAHLISRRHTAQLRGILAVTVTMALAALLIIVA